MTAIDRCNLRMDILLCGTRRMIEDLKDRKDLKRTICPCGQPTKFDACSICFMERLRKEQGL